MSRMVGGGAQAPDVPAAAMTMMNHWVRTALTPSTALKNRLFPPDLSHPSLRDKGLAPMIRDVPAFAFEVHDSIFLVGV